MLKEFEKNLRQYGLISSGDTIVIGVSGGVDSVVLLSLFNKLKTKYKLKLIVAHVNHHLRKKESEDDEIFVKKLAKKLKLECKIGHWRKNKKGNVQEMTRDFRYSFFKKIAKKEKAFLIATAHNQNDQIETFFIRLVRGSGIKGLSGMDFITIYNEKNCNFKIIRPLLNISRDKIENFAKHSKITFRIDESNLKVKYTRNKIRHEIMPILKTINPRINESISDIIEILKDNWKAVDIMSKAFASEYFTILDKKIIWNRIPFLELPASIRRQVIIEAYSIIRGNKDNFNSDQILRIEFIAKSKKTSGEYMLPDFMRFIRQKDMLIIEALTS